jgi:DNA-binding response OmpR family regulator
MRILIADDERTLVKILCEVMHRNKFSTDFVYNGLDAFEYAKNYEYDLIILDIMLPKISGLDVVKKLRENNISTPVLMLSAKGEVDDKVNGLNLGADDYLSKPFATSELLARIKALTRRKGEFLGDILRYGDIELDKNNCTLGGIKLTNTEFKIMEILVRTPEKIIRKDKLIEKVWGVEDNSCYNNVEVYISFLRKKLSALGSSAVISAVRGVGYSLGGGNA